MRHPPDWMKPADERILEYLSSEGFGTPKAIADTIGMNNDYISSRCSELTDEGYLERAAHGVYRITDTGEDYLSGALQEGSE